MFSNLFLLQLFLSFVVGGTVISLSVFMAEKFGPKLGAVILSLPSTSLVGFFFIGLTNSPTIVTTVVPFSIVAMAIYLVFLSFFILICEKFGKIALIVAIIFWFFLALLILKLSTLSLLAATLIFLFVYAIANLYFRNKKFESKVEKPATSVSTFLFRSLFGGLIISTAVFLSKTVGPDWAGLFVMFPAATISSYAIFSASYKKEFVLSVAIKMLPLSLVIVFYALLVYFAYPFLGIYLGTILSLLLTFCFSYLFNQVIK